MCLSRAVLDYWYKDCNLSGYWSTYIQDTAIHIWRIICNDSHGLQDTSYTRTSTPLGSTRHLFKAFLSYRPTHGASAALVRVLREEEPYSRVESDCVLNIAFFTAPFLRSALDRIRDTSWFRTAPRYAILVGASARDKRGSQLIIFCQTNSARGPKKRWHGFREGTFASDGIIRTFAVACCVRFAM